MTDDAFEPFLPTRLGEATTDDLMRSLSLISDELTRREILMGTVGPRSANVLGAYAEWLMWQFLREEGAQPTVGISSSDFVLRSGRRVDVKSRLNAPAGARSPSVDVRTPLAFDDLAAVVFDPNAGVEGAWIVPRDVVQTAGRPHGSTLTLKLSAALQVKPAVRTITNDLRRIAKAPPTAASASSLADRLRNLAAFLLRPPQKRISSSDAKMIEAAADLLDADRPDSDRAEVSNWLRKYAQRKYGTRSLSSSQRDLLISAAEALSTSSANS